MLTPVGVCSVFLGIRANKIITNGDVKCLSRILFNEVVGDIREDLFHGRISI